MGWKRGEGLGPAKQGIVQPIVAKVRGKTDGLGLTKEAGRLKANVDAAKRVFAHHKDAGEATADLVGEGGSDDDAEEAGPGKEAWRVGGGKATKRKTVYKTPYEMLAEAGGDAGAASAPQLIVDHRGPQVKVLSSLAGLEHAGRRKRRRGELDDGDDGGAGRRRDDASEAGDAATAALGKELLHNLGLLVNTTEVEMHTLHRKIQTEQGRIAQLSADEADLRDKVHHERDEVAALTEINELVARAMAKLPPEVSDGDDGRAPRSGGDGTDGSRFARAGRPRYLTLSSLRDVVEDLRQRYSQEYVVYELHLMIPAFLVRLVDDALISWDPLADVASLSGTIPFLWELQQWRDYLYAAEEPGQDAAGTGVAVAFDELVESRLLPKARSAARGWDVRRQRNSMLALVSALESLLTSEAFDSFLVHSVFARIAQEVDEWDALSDPVPLHEWTQPWQARLGTDLASLWPGVRTKLAAALQRWDPADPSARQVLAPWKAIWDRLSFHSLLLKCIMPKLVPAVRAMTIDPNNQRSLGLIREVLAWTDLMPRFEMVCLLEGELFPQWFRTLHAWLASGEADFEEVSRWYSGWKSLFPEALTEDVRIQAMFSQALKLMSAAVALSAEDDSDIDDDREATGGAKRVSAMTRLPMPDIAGTVETTSYESVLAARRQSQRRVKVETAEALARRRAAGAADAAGGARAAAGAGAGAGAGPADHSLTTREVVQWFAERNGVDFVPNLRRGKHEGKTVYLFGGVNVYVSDGVVFAEATGADAGRFEPVDLEDLLTRVRRR